MVRASIDLGTQTCLLLIVDWDPDKKKIERVLEDRTTIVRLGQGVDQNRELASEAMVRTLTCLQGYAEKIRSYGILISDVVCVGTSQARDAKNGTDFFSQVNKKIGLSFRILSGEEEARLTFQGGLLPEMDAASSAVIDIGGGSTELMAQKGGRSVDMGSVRFTERYLKSDPVKDQEFWRCQEVIDQNLRPLKNWQSQLFPNTQLVAVAGTATTLAAWHLGLERFDARAIDAVFLSRGDVHRMVEELKWRTIEERKQLPGIEPGRADILLAGALILWRAMELLDFKTVRVSTRGLRYGVLSL